MIIPDTLWLRRGQTRFYNGALLITTQIANFILAQFYVQALA